MNLVPEWIFRMTPRCRRFERDLDAFEDRLHADPDPPWKPKALRSLDRARARRRIHDLDGAWFNLREAARKEIPTLRGEQLRDRKELFLCEARKKLSGWRECAVDALLKEEAPSDSSLAERLESAQALLDDYFQNYYYKSGLLLGQMRNLVSIGLIALAALVALIAGTNETLTKWDDWSWQTLLLVLLFGILGASFSATLKLPTDIGKSKIPEFATSLAITLARTILGATPALAAYAFLRSGLFTIGANGGDETPIAVALAVAFGAGFSERLVLRMLKLLDDKGTDK
jgi:hypothetical protein